MCTVTYLPTEAGYILTSSRDEYNFRSTLSPASYRIKGQMITFPKDEVAGGTWIAASDSGKVVCLLNGAIENFEPKSHYIQSRGKILIEYFGHASAESFLESVDCSHVAPFTLLMLEGIVKIKITQFRWDGERKFVKVIDSGRPKLWASATLYDKEQIVERKLWYQGWLLSQEIKSSENMKSFHTANHTSDPTNNIVMKREQGLQTVSVTQIINNQTGLMMKYHDLIAHVKSDLKISICDQVLS